MPQLCRRVKDPKLPHLAPRFVEPPEERVPIADMPAQIRHTSRAALRGALSTALARAVRLTHQATSAILGLQKESATRHH
jgi:hypothetical protein